MFENIENLVLSGQLFNASEGPSSPPRTPSPDHGWHDDELNSEDEDNDAQSRGPGNEKVLGESTGGAGIGMGPGRTGVKGVIRDADEAKAIASEQKAKEARELAKRMEKASLGGKTFLEEERERMLAKENEEGVSSKQNWDQQRDVFGNRKAARFGHLREVGVDGFVNAVEMEQKGVWVIVHLFDATLERCFILDDTLSRLARAYPSTKFLHARAASLGFASRPKTKKNAAPLKPVRYEDEEDPYEDEDGTETDLDMLPTMLVYRDGQLEYNWVRVDWEAGRNGIEEFLRQHHILGTREGPYDESSQLPDSDDDYDDRDDD